MKAIYQQRRSEFWVALITALMVIVVGVEEGIILAIVLSLINHTRRGYRPKNALLQPAGTGTWRAQPVASRVQALPGLAVYRFTHSMYYANAEQFSEEVVDLANSADSPLRWLCIDASAIDDVDFSAAETLRSIFSILKGKGIRLVVAQVMADVKKESRYHCERLFGQDAFYETLEDVVSAYRQGVKVEV
jgi:SulP family sulfate permease